MNSKTINNQKEIKMTKKQENQISIYAVDEIIKIGKAFEKEGKELGTLFIKKTDLKFIKKELDIHSSDIDKDNEVIAFVTCNDETKYHRQWYKLVTYKSDEFDSWKLESEKIEYRN
jgi:hypothetical protein|tara:strand:+ start:122 stop:469 length:348 start_codon:yes stop_codon:yes gene_type:complete